MTYKTCEKGIYELIKTLASTNVFAMRAPDNQAGPFIIFQRVDRDNLTKNTLNRTAGVAGVVQAVIQIDAYAAGYYDAKELGASIEFLLDGYSGTVYHGEDSPQDFVEIGGITLQNDGDIIDQTDQPLLFRNSATYLVTYKQ